MRLFKFFIFIVIVSSDLFCGNTCSRKQADIKEVEEAKVYHEPQQIELTVAQKQQLLKIKIKEIIKAKAGINYKYYLFSKYGNQEYGTLLEFTTDLYDTKSVKLLLKNGANPDIKFSIGHFKNNNKDLIEYLLNVPTLLEYCNSSNQICYFIKYQRYFNELKKKLKDNEILLLPVVDLVDIVLEYIYEII